MARDPFTYDTMRRYIGRQAGMSRVVGPSSTAGSIAANTTWSTDVEDALADALERVYHPVMLPGEEQHQWSFLTPTLRFEFAAEQYLYDLPYNFSSFMGPLTITGDNGVGCDHIEITSPERVLRNRQRETLFGRPSIAAVRIKAIDGLQATKYELILWPTPAADLDEPYVAEAQCKVNPLIIGPDDATPMGGQSLRQVLLASCRMTIAKLLDEYDNGELKQDFMEQLAAAISEDRMRSMPHTLGYNHDRSDWYGAMDGLHNGNSNLVTYNGTVPGE